MRKLMCSFLLLAAAVNCFAAPDPKPAPHEVMAKPLTDVDADGYILFTYCLNDAEQLGEKSALPDIKIQTVPDGKTFRFDKHVLSCGSVMVAHINKTAVGTVTMYTGDFQVSHNPYKIDTLIADYSKDSATGKLKGYLIVNDRKIDINLF